MRSPEKILVAFIPSQYSAAWDIAQIFSMETVDIGLGQLMQINTFIRASVGADVSALGACSDVRMKKLKCMNIVAVVALVADVSFVSVVAQEAGAKVCYNSVNKFLHYQRRKSHAHSHRTTISQR